MRQKSAQLDVLHHAVEDLKNELAGFKKTMAGHWGRGGLETGDYMLGTFRAHVHLSHNVTGG